jgi:hypothetical protein
MLAAVACAGCHSPVAIPGVQAVLDFSANAGFYDAPYPIAYRMNANGVVRVDDFPGQELSASLQQIITMIEQQKTGFSLNGAIWIRFTGALNAARLPTPASSLQPDSPLFLVNVTPSSPSYGQRIALDPTFKTAAETYSPANLLVALPYQGSVMEPETTYALVVLRSLGDASGHMLGSPLALEQLKAGVTPAGANGPAAVQAFQPLWSYLAHAHMDRSTVAAATVFTTGNPTAHVQGWRNDVAAMPAPTTPTISFLENDGYCVVSGNMTLPLFQKGPKPYDAAGSGGFVEDMAGHLVQQDADSVPFVATIPNGAMPPNGWPIMLFAAGGGGSERQVLDRTLESLDPSQGLGPPGNGPALYLANRGIAAFGFPAPLTLERNPTGADGTLDFFNVQNFQAFRDNIVQGALDFTTVLKVTKALQIPTALCPGSSTADGGPFHYDPANILFWGHSTGSTIGSLAIPLEPDFKAGMLSGAGGSWIYNVALADSPVPLRIVAGALLNLQAGEVLDIYAPVLTLFQTALEDVEVMDWAPFISRQPLPGSRPRDLLLMQGVVDTYHYARMVSSYAMSTGLDLVGPPVEPTAASDYALVGHSVIAAPASANILLQDGSRVTNVCVQHEQRPGVDGHYVPFEFEDLKYRYSCFLQCAVAGRAILPVQNADSLDEAISVGLAPCVFE